MSRWPPRASTTAVPTLPLAPVTTTLIHRRYPIRGIPCALLGRPARMGPTQWVTHQRQPTHLLVGIVSQCADTDARRRPPGVRWPSGRRPTRAWRIRRRPVHVAETHRVTTVAQLEPLLGVPVPRVAQKVRPLLHRRD